IAISPVLGKGLAEFKWLLRIQSLIFSEINGVAGFLLVSTWADARGSRAIHRKELSEPVRHFSRYIRRLASRGRSHRAMSAPCSQFCALSATFGGNGDGAHNLEAPGDIGERIVQIATTGGGFRRGRFTGLSPHGGAVHIVSESRVLSSELMR